MKKIINISDGTQKGKTTHILKETETCTEFVNINLVYEYNVVLEDVLQKAKQFNIIILKNREISTKIKYILHNNKYKRIFKHYKFPREIYFPPLIMSK